MNTQGNEEIRAVLGKVRSSIACWKKETKCYRIWNIILFASFRLLIPLGSLAVATSAFSDVQGHALFTPVTKLVTAGLVLLLSSLDSILNPGSRKRVALKTNNALRELENEVDVMAASLPDNELVTVICEANSKLRAILDEYAEKGY